MPREAIIILIFGIFILILAIIFTITIFKNIKNHLEYNHNGHKIEIVMSYTFARLLFDGKIVDEIKTYRSGSVKLSANIEGIDIRVQIGTGFLKPIFTAFINNELVEFTKKNIS